MAGTARPYEMTVDLSVLESLGINLYSNAAAVLSELVANAYDADATKVSISWKDGAARVVVEDNGCGMTVKQLNDRFLKAGYKKRQVEGATSPAFGRKFMGRKGIGKLAVFSIAKDVAVYTRVGKGQANGLRILVDDLETAIKSRKKYYPKPVAVPSDFIGPGTRIVLTDLKSKRADLTAAALRKRLARRFDVMDNTPANEGGFKIYVNGTAITWADRQELKRLEFIWEFGKKALPTSALPDGVTRFVLKSPDLGKGKGWYVKGWFGTAKKPTDLTSDQDAGSLKNIIVLARKRPIQEGIIDKLDFSRIFGNYVTGQIEAEFLDLDDPGYDDIATSDRQRLMEDDDRVVALRDFLRKAFVKAADDWSAHRPRKQAADALERYPKLRTWVNQRPSWQRGAAYKMIGTIASLELERNTVGQDRIALFRSGILAFERLALREVSQELDKLGEITSAELLPLLGAQDEYESGLWVDILRSRIEAIEKFRGLTDVNEKEKVLQKHLFNHLWLLDAAWERATGSPRMEEDLRKLDEKTFGSSASVKNKFGRIDIRYATLGGRHVIVELKRYKVRPDIDVLYEQGLKYYDALAAGLSKQNRSEESVEVVFVLGDHPGTKSKGKMSEAEYRSNRLQPINGRYVLYDELINNAQAQYDDYFRASDRARELDQLLSSLDRPGDDDNDLAGG